MIHGNADRSCLFQGNLLSHHEKDDPFIYSSPKPKKWFDISIVATRLDSNQKTLIINWFYIIAFNNGHAILAKKPALEAGFNTVSEPPWRIVEPGNRGFEDHIQSQNIDLQANVNLIRKC